ncbi:MAG: nucleotidyl transferase AbiEii/AbiGii toxin family protein [Deltaproteobacteria bacterium]|nr:nucleotidyl transferase AbiEii/AbiGii toxin family protein [Deltaproteobacteria bacterium]
MTGRARQAALATDLTDPDKVPYFLWDRTTTVSGLRAILADPGHPQRVPLLRTMLREARTDDVWAFVEPQVVADEWDAIAPGLGRRRAFWAWLIAEWRRLGSDLVHETAAQVVPVHEKPVRDGIRLDALPDLIANKLCALLGRAEVKDLVDLYFIARGGLDPLAHLDAARRKDGGMDPSTLAFVLRDVPVDPFSLDLLLPVSAVELAAFRDDLVRRLVALSWPR